MTTDWFALIRALLRRRNEVTQKNMQALAASVARLEIARGGENTLPLTSRPCRQADLLTDWHRAWCEACRMSPNFHRKQWEYCYILQALFERGCLESGRRGLGFGVGREPLVAVMAARGVEVVATDLDVEAARKNGWTATAQHAPSLAALNEQSICAVAEFQRLVTCRVVDMNSVPQDLRDFDFVWSSCAFEHLGSLANGLRFVVQSSRCLKVGGVGVHTTEFNLSSNDKTVDKHPTVLFRRRDLEDLGAQLQLMGCELEHPDFDPGTGILDHYVDLPPYKSDVHRRIPYHQYTITSFGIIVRRLS